MPLQAIIFDFHGLVLDTESAEFAGWSEVFRSHSVDLDIHEWAKCVGRAPEEWLPESHLQDLVGEPIDLRQARLDAFRLRDEILVDLQPLPGAVELLDELAHESVPVAIASSSRSVWVEGLLANIGLRDRFPVIKTRDIVGKAKPWPDLYLAACQALEVSPSCSVALEDSPVGVSAAVSAQMSVVAVPNNVTRHFDLSNAHLVLESLADLSLARARELVLANETSIGD